jgi:hypothetical protein
VTRTPANSCPHCGYVVDSTSSARGDDATPREGSITICFRCEGVSVFRADLTLRLPTSAEEPEIRAALAQLGFRC